MNKVIEVTMSLYPKEDAHFIHIKRADRKCRLYQRNRNSKAFRYIGNYLEDKPASIQVSYLRSTTFIKHSFKGEK